MSKPKIINLENKINEVLTRGVEEVISLENLRKRLLSGKQLRIKLGIDPTSPNIHLGRSIPLLKLKDFQELGHKIIFIIGDFTGVIGDTSDKDSERPMLSKNEIEKNLKNYVSQAKKIIDIEKCEVHCNSKWLSKLGYGEIGKQADKFSLNEFASRDNIKKRFESGKRVSVRELLYPLMQGYDSVVVKADVEIGGTDQKFNLLAGRELQRLYKQEPQDILTNPLIEGLDGRKMSSSWDNTINLLDESGEMYGKVMSLKDELIIKYFTLATRISLEEIKSMQKRLDEGENPKNVKMKLAKEIVRIYHGKEASEKAEKKFEDIFSKGGVPDEITEVSIDVVSGRWLVDAFLAGGIIFSRTEGKRLISNGAVTNMDTGQKITDPNTLASPGTYKIGSRRFIKIK